MKHWIFKESVIFMTLMAMLAVMMHGDLLTDPLTRYEVMMERGNLFHPFIWTALVYLALALIRGILKALMKLRARFQDEK